MSALIVPAALVAAGCGGDGGEEPVTDDTAVVTDSDGATSGGMLVDGGLSVAEALARSGGRSTTSPAWRSESVFGTVSLLGV